MKKITIFVIVTISVALAFEVLLRLVLTYHVDFYAQTNTPGVYKLPYGTVLVNSLGFLDDEFILDDPRPRVGYIGDSVVAGTGAGHGYRISDLLESARPDYQHLNLVSAPNGIQDVEPYLKLVDRFDLDAVVYVMNLNDILPLRKSGNDAPKTLFKVVSNIVVSRFDFLRTRSFLYNKFRSQMRGVLRRKGINVSGLPAFELYPKKFDGLIKEVVEGINHFAGEMRSRGKHFCVMIIPYEMQISEEASRRYKQLGIHWEDGFLDQSTQRAICKYMDPKIEYLNAYYAFVDSSNIEKSRSENGLGEFFVYDQGDKLDYNHPNRAGHRKIAEYALEKSFCIPYSLQFTKEE